MSSRKKSQDISEWSWPVEADKVDAKPLKIHMECKPDERRALARRLGLRALDSLVADITLSRKPGLFGVYAEGVLRAEVGQDCVVTGAPVDSVVEDRFEAWFADRDKTVPFARAKHDRATKTGESEIPMLDESEDPEPIVDGVIDLGELVTQYLSLAIDLYPRSPDAGEPPADEPEKPRIDNPFAALKGWKGKK